MATTIQVSERVKKHLDRLRLHPRESYDDVIDRVLEDFEELGEETKTRIAEAEKDIKAGRVIPHAEVKRRLGLE
jgi:predicted transcriptional regulator